MNESAPAHEDTPPQLNGGSDRSAGFSPKIVGPSPPLDRWCVAAIAAGVLVRAVLLLTGRTLLDGDEAVMGIMANHVGHLERLPLYFYGQHYLGTVELPPLVLLQWLGPEGWKFSVWPIRIVEMLYFVGLCCIHFKLVSRFFGVQVGRWSLFFLCVAPVFWVDYSARLRHVTFMMMIGEAMTLVALDLIATWNAERKASGRRLLLLGFLGGIAWWHYQLIIVYLAGVTVLLVGFSSFAVDWIRRPSSGASGVRNVVSPAAVTRLLLMCGSIALLAGLSLGWWAEHWERYPLIIGLLLLAFGSTVLWSWVEARREKSTGTRDPLRPSRSAPRALIPGMIGIGFIAGNAPALIYLLKPRADYYIPRFEVRFWDVFSRSWDLLLLEFGGMLEFNRAVEPVHDLRTTNPRTYIFFLLYTVGFYLLVRCLVRPRVKAERMGAVFFLAVMLTLVALHILVHRATPIAEPRFLIPAFSLTSVLLGLVTGTIGAQIHDLKGKNRSFLPLAVGALIVCGSFVLWAPRWFALEREALHWRSGHRLKAVNIVRALKDRDIERVVLGGGYEWIVLGYELAYASRMSIRFNREAMGDRFGGIVDEDRFRGEEFLMTRLPWRESERDELLRTARESDSSEGTLPRFEVEGYFVRPLPKGHNVRGRPTE